jgi:hypothetical protein
MIFNCFQVSTFLATVMVFITNNASFTILELPPFQHPSSDEGNFCLYYTKKELCTAKIYPLTLYYPPLHQPTWTKIATCLPPYYTLSLFVRTMEESAEQCTVVFA